MWDTLGMVQQAQGDDAAAVVSFHHALRLDPNSAGAKSRMTASLLKLSPDQTQPSERRRGQAARRLPRRPNQLRRTAPGPKARAPTGSRSRAQAQARATGQAVAATGWSKRPAPEPPAKEEPLPAPVPPAAAALAPKPEPKPIPEPKPRPAPALKAKPKPTAPPAQREGRPPVGWYLQLSSNRNPNLAMQARDRWRAAGHSAYVWDWRSRKSGLWHRVLIGPYAGKRQGGGGGAQVQGQWQAEGLRISQSPLGRLGGFSHAKRYAALAASLRASLWLLTIRLRSVARRRLA